VPIRLTFIGLVLWASAAGAEPGVILHQTHTSSGKQGVDTLRTYITPSHVRVEHAHGDAILDVQRGQLILLDRGTRTWRQMPLDEWENLIRRAAETIPGQPADAAVQRPSPAFERVGSPVRRAGYVCDRWSLYTRRELLPGEVDWVEQHLWVARGLELPEGAYESYDRAIRGLDSIGMGTVIERPRGVVLASEIRSGTEAEHERGDVEIEQTNVYRVEKTDIAPEVFEVPPSYHAAPSDASNDADPSDPNDPDDAGAGTPRR
jgi:hypothetical protein